MDFRLTGSGDGVMCQPHMRPSQPGGHAAVKASVLGCCNQLHGRYVAVELSVLKSLDLCLIREESDWL